MDYEGLRELYPSMRKAIGIIDHLHLIEPSALPKALEVLKDHITELADEAYTNRVIADGKEQSLNKALDALRILSGASEEDLPRNAHVIPQAFRGLELKPKAKPAPRPEPTWEDTGTRHICDPSDRAFGRTAKGVAMGCPRCIELANGAAPRAWRRSYA